MKKNMMKAAAVFLLAAISIRPVFADTKGDYINVQGRIQEVHNEGDILSLVVETKDGGPMIFKITDDVIIVDGDSSSAAGKDSLTSGKELMAAYKTNIPMILIYPPQVTPETVVIMPENGSFVKIDSFDENNLSSDGELQINVSDETKISDLSGSPVPKEEISGKPLAVFYIMTTMSIPPQTPPEKIIVLSSTLSGEPSETDPVISDFLPEQLYEQNGIKYVRLADLAAKFGYDVEWNGENKTVTLLQGNASYVITIGEEMYSHNRALGYFNEAPIIVDDRTFVEIEFISVLSR